MSENAKNLGEILTCEICQKYYLNPVILPCGNNICEEHVQKKIKVNQNTKNQEYQCEFCQSKHEVPNNGFIVNKPFIQMINNNLHLDEKTKTAKKVIEDLVTSNSELNLMVKDPKNFIYSYFSDEKNKIDLKRETLISKINDISDEMINKIKQMENDAKSNLNEKQLIDQNKIDFNKLTETVLNWNEELRNPKLKKTRLDKIIKESNSLLRENKSQSFQVKNKILNEKGCYFTPNNDEFKKELFGELLIDDFSKINQREILNSPLIVFDSNIINSDQSNELIKLCEFEDKKEFKLLYRASRDGFSSKSFHLKCDFISKTLTVIKVKDQPHIFGGYTEATWEGILIYKEDPNAFIFSLVNNDNKPIKMKINQINKYAIGCHPSYGPTFGGSDIDINSGSNANRNSYSNLGHTYRHPHYQFKSNEAKNFLAGSYYFTTSEIEVFQII